MKALWIVLGSTLLIVLGRFAVPGHELSWAGSYEAVAHIWVGALITLVMLYPLLARAGHGRLSAVALLCLGTATVVETVMFLTRG